MCKPSSEWRVSIMNLNWRPNQSKIVKPFINAPICIVNEKWISECSRYNYYNVPIRKMPGFLIKPTDSFFNMKWERRQNLQQTVLQSKKRTSVITEGFVAKCNFFYSDGQKKWKASFGFIKLTSIYIKQEVFYTSNINYIHVKKCGFRNIEISFIP